MKTTPNTTKGDDSMDTEEKAVDNKIVTAKVKPPADETESQNNQTVRCLKYFLYYKDQWSVEYTF